MQISRTTIFVIAFVALLLILSVNTLPLYVDWLWFTEVNLSSLFLTILSAKLFLGAAGAILFFVITFLNFRYASRYKPLPVWNLWESQFRITGLESIKPLIGKILFLILVFLSILVGISSSFQWNQYLLFNHATPFNINDPIFERDVSFYVFRLPFFTSIQGWLFTTVLLTAFGVIIIYILKQCIRFTARGLYIEKLPRLHTGILIAILLALKAWDFYLERYQILFSQRGVIFGAGYTDININLPVLNILAVLSLLSAAVVIYDSYKGSLKPTLITVGALILTGIVGLIILPDTVQRYKVVPNEIELEREYILHHIRFTRSAYALDGIEEKEFSAEDTLTFKDIINNDLTIKNVRLWDHRPLLSTYKQLQQIRTYYDFVDVDNDRYVIDGEYRQVMLSPREISYNNLPSRIWINEHLTYTHGYGVSMGPVNMISKEGLPIFFIKDIPPASTVDITVTRPELYYGEIGNEYVFVNTTALEFDYPVGDQNNYTRYQGRGGVLVDSLLKKLAFAAHFGTVKILLSPAITDESRIMYQRNIMNRVYKAAPFLLFDRDPYMVISEKGELFWIIDGYTSSSMVPYSHPVQGLGNYIRNSVKVVINAYHGSMDFYVNDPEDPVIKTYAGIFPEMFKPLNSMPEDLRMHLRYPQDLFSIQASLYAMYHMQDPQIFYNKEDLWNIPVKGAGGGIEAAMEPYYTIMRLPGEEHEEFILLIPFTPSRRDNMAAWLAARSDGDHYGHLIVYIFPKQKLIYGPRQVEARIDQDAHISQQLTLWNQRGSQVIRGSLLVIPIEKSLLYIEPLYLAAQSGSIPELRRVIVAYENQLVMEENLDIALQRLFGGRVQREAVIQREAGPPPPVSEAIDVNARKALEIYNRAQEFQHRGDWAGYGEELKKLENVLKEMAGK